MFKPHLPTAITGRRINDSQARMHMAAAHGDAVDHISFNILIPPLMPVRAGEAGE